VDVSFERLAAVLSERLGSVLPMGMTVVITTSDVAERMAQSPEVGVDGCIAQLLTGIADEACDHTTDRYEADAEIDGDRLRLWFGLVPPGSGDAPRWRDVLPELAPIPMVEIIGR
jgi:hypothetical protein